MLRPVYDATDGVDRRLDSIHGTYAQSQAVPDDLAALGIDYAEVVQILEDQGVTTFDASWVAGTAIPERARCRGLFAPQPGNASPLTWPRLFRSPAWPPQDPHPGTGTRRI